MFLTGARMPQGTLTLLVTSIRTPRNCQNSPFLISELTPSYFLSHVSCIPKPCVAPSQTPNCNKPYMPPYTVSFPSISLNINALRTPRKLFVHPRIPKFVDVGVRKNTILQILQTPLRVLRAFLSKRFSSYCYLYNISSYCYLYNISSYCYLYNISSYCYLYNISSYCYLYNISSYCYLYNISSYCYLYNISSYCYLYNISSYCYLYNISSYCYLYNISSYCYLYNISSYCYLYNISSYCYLYNISSYCYLYNISSYCYLYNISSYCYLYNISSYCCLYNMAGVRYFPTIYTPIRNSFTIYQFVKKKMDTRES